MAGQVDQDVDAVVADQPSDRFIGHAHDFVPLIDGVARKCHGGIGIPHITVADDFVLAMIVILNQGLEKPVDRMLEKIVGDVSDANPSVGIAVVGVGSAGLAQRLGVLGIPSLRSVRPAGPSFPCW